MELRHLRYFVAVAQELNFSRAAEKLHIAQPPLSAQIRSLEDELGFELFTRTNRAVRLTAEGAAFLGRAQETLRSAELTQQSARQIAQGRLGTLRIGVVPSAITHGVAAGLRRFRETHSSVNLVVQQGGPADLREELLAERVDLVVNHLRASADRRISSRPFERHSWLLALPPGHSLASKSVLEWEDLISEKVIGLRPDVSKAHFSPLQAEFDRRAMTANYQPIADDLQTLIWLVSAGFGVCAFPASLTDTASPGVIFRRLSPMLPELILSVEWLSSRRSTALSELIKFFPELQITASDQSAPSTRERAAFAARSSKALRHTATRGRQAKRNTP